jgi:putative oxidoreductase
MHLYLLRHRRDISHEINYHRGVLLKDLNTRKARQMFRKLIATSSTWITVPLRLALAAVFLGHGAQKVLGSFGGHGLSAWTSGEAPFSFMRPAWLWLGLAAFSELIGGLLVLLGLFTRVGAFLIACNMLVAILGPLWPQGFMAKGGYEYPLALLAMCLALVIGGGGQASVDRALAGSGGKRR